MKQKIEQRKRNPVSIEFQDKPYLWQINCYEIISNKKEVSKAKILPLETINNTEQVVERWYNNRGYETVNLGRGVTNIFESLPEKAISQLASKIIGSVLLEMSDQTPDRLALSKLPGKGAPDIFAYKLNGEELEDFYFTEVKTRKHGLSRSQIKWLNKYEGREYRVAYVDKIERPRPKLGEEAEE